MANLPLSHNPRLKDPLFLGALDHGVRLAFETDWTVAPLNLLLTVMRIPTRSIWIWTGRSNATNRRHGAGVSRLPNS